MSLRFRWPLVLTGALVCFLTGGLYGQESLARRISSYVDDRERVVLRGQRHPLARAEFSRGEAPAEMRLEHMILMLQPEEALQRELEALLAAQQDPSSPDYHRWLTPQEFGRRFGVSEWDLRQVLAWLEARGFEVEPVAESRRAMVFSGTVAKIASAFHTPIHRYAAGGGLHYANAADPEIPKALAAVVGGVVSLHDFRSRPMHVAVRPAAGPSPEFTSGSAHYMAPADFAAIYNLRPLYSAALDGRGQSIAVVGRSNIKASDIQAFRNLFGLPAGDPEVMVNGRDPGVLEGDEQFEAQLDVEWAGAVAHGAQVQFVTSASTTASDGVALSAQYIVEHNLAPIVSVSFGSCEAEMGAAGNQFWNSLWQQAAAQGMTVLVASGDSGAAGCDGASSTAATAGRGVNGLCSSPHGTCVGGTQFNDTANPAMYWSTTNAASYGSAIGYIPESPWNTSGSAGSGLWATGGGASSQYRKPSWQSGAGVPLEDYRYVPDVSLNGSPHDGYMVTVNGQLYVAGGTSASAPAMAGIMALALQKQGARIGNASPGLYSLAALQAGGGAAVFHDVTAGDNSVPGLDGCSAGPGYDAVTGLGSVDGAQLVNHWNEGSVAVPSFQMGASAASVAITQGGSVTVALTVVVKGGFRNDVTLSAGTLPAGVTATFSPARIASPGAGTSTLALGAGAQSVPGSYGLTLTAKGGGVTETAPLAVTIGPRCSYSLARSTQAAVASGATYSVAVTATAGCAWTAMSAASWITITSGASGTGNGTVAYTVAANGGAAVRTGSLTIAGLLLSVTQDGAPSFSLGALTASFGAAGGTGTAVLTAPSSTTSWTAISNAAWMTITNGGSGVGSKTIAYSVATNPTASRRTGSLTIAGLTLSVTQDGVPPFSLGALTASFGAAGGTGTAVLTAPSSTTSWTAVSNAAWMTITNGGSGVGSKTIAYSVAANATTSRRTGSLTIAGLSLSVTQDGAPSFSLGALTASFGAAGGTGTAVLTAPSSTASWTAVSNAPWMTVTNGVSGVGSKTIAYSVAANATTSRRTGSLTIAGLLLSVTQDGAPSFSLGSLTASFGGAGGTGTAVLTASLSTASWTAVSNAAWMTITNGGSGTGSKTIAYSVAANTTTSIRTGTLKIAGLTLTVTQAAACSYAITLGPVTPGKSGFAGSVTVKAASGCSWTASSDVNWITISAGAAGSGNGTVRYAALPNTTHAARTGVLTVAGYAIRMTEGAQSAQGMAAAATD